INVPDSEPDDKADDEADQMLSASRVGDETDKTQQNDDTTEQNKTKPGTAAQITAGQRTDPSSSVDSSVLPSANKTPAARWNDDLREQTIWIYSRRQPDRYTQDHHNDDAAEQNKTEPGSVGQITASKRSDFSSSHL